MIDYAYRHSPSSRYFLSIHGWILTEIEPKNRITRFLLTKKLNPTTRVGCIFLAEREGCASLARKSLIDASICTLIPVRTLARVARLNRVRTRLRNKKRPTKASLLYLAEREGFEPSRELALP